MMTRLVTTLSAALALALVTLAPAGCKKDDAATGDKPAGDKPAGDKPAGDKPAGDKPAGGKPAAAGASWKAGDPVTVESLEAIAAGVASCAFQKDNGFGLDDCPAKDTFGKAISSLPMIDAAKMGDAVGRKLIVNASPQVRALGASYLASITGTDTASGDVIAEAMGKEQDPRALATMVRMAGPVADDSAKVAAAVVAAGSHADKWVRFHAVVIMGNKKVAGATAKLLEMIEGDADAYVRKAACATVGGHGDDAALPMLEKHTADAKDELYADCFEGLVAMWAGYPFFETGSKKAYELTLKRLGAKPRADQVPPFQVFGNIGYLSDSKNERAAAWKAKNGWFKADALVNVLGDIVADPEAGYTPKVAALKCAVAHGATKKQLEAWRKAYGDKPEGKHNSIVKNLDEAVAAAK